jgi:calcineurin-like phosphoesterase family protein
MWPQPVFSLLLLLILFAPLATAQSKGVWRFAVSGDSRNCGDIVMPAIAHYVLADNALFYWHLGDFRAIYTIDQDYAQTHQKANSGVAPSMEDYLAGAWDDFIESQLSYFGDTPVFLALGNHDNIPPKDHNQAVAQFADWLNAPAIRSQRLADNATDHAVKAYYHWQMSGIEFVTLDNSAHTFEPAQLTWLHNLLDRDAQDFSIRAIVLGMHEALPDSISADHSMNQSAAGTAAGRTLSDWLVDFKARTHKPVYVLASHSHYYMQGIFNTPEWRKRGVPMPGWIIGTAGAIRYPLPPNAGDAKEAKTGVYGYLLATVDTSQEEPITFEFRQLAESDVPADVVARYTPALVHDCWVNNIRR